MDTRARLPETTLEQRFPFYREIEQLLSPGFLSFPVCVEDTELCLRSPSPGDIFLLRSRVGVKVTERKWKLWALASLTWMVNGVLYLGDPNSPALLKEKIYSKLPKTVLNNLFSSLMTLFSSIEKNLFGVQAYCFEDSSRFLWNQTRGHLLSSETASGIPGTSRLGLNTVQRMWTAYNQVEDLRQQDYLDMSKAVFIASAFSPKGAKQFNAKEKIRREREDIRRQEEKDRFYYRQIGVLDDEKALSDGRQWAVRSKSPEDLVGEFKSWVGGEKDEHDLVVEEYKRNLLAAFEEEKMERREKILFLRGDEGEDHHKEPLVGYDIETLAELLQEREGRPGTRTIYDDSFARKQLGVQTHLSQKAKAPPPGGFVMKDGKPAFPEEARRKRQLLFNAGPEEERS